jgi:hypothetical protein
MPNSRPKGRRPQPLDHWPALRQELVALIAELERFPTPNDLERRGRYDLMRALVRHGGSAAVARRLTAEAEAAKAGLEATDDDARAGAPASVAG